jgi:hypothetical protein
MPYAQHVDTCDDCNENESNDERTTCIRLEVEVLMIQHMIEDSEPFLLNQRSEEEMANYGAGFNAGLAGENVDENKSEAWLRGWAEAQG